MAKSRRKVNKNWSKAERRRQKKTGLNLAKSGPKKMAKNSKGPKMAENGKRDSKWPAIELKILTKGLKKNHS